MRLLEDCKVRGKKKSYSTCLHKKHDDETKRSKNVSEEKEKKNSQGESKEERHFKKINMLTK